MKNILLLTALLLMSVLTFGQVNYTDNFGPITLTSNGIVNGKNSYQGTDAPATVTVSWSGTQWEIFIDVGSGDVLSFSSTAVTALNPPDLTIGNWQDEAADGTDLLGFDGPGTTNVLPVELTSFSAAINAQNVALNWTTSTEINNHGFDVQRSIDGDVFKTLTFVTGNGTTSETQYYSYVDDNLQQKQTYYYRLKQMDFDGQFEFSEVIAATVDFANESYTKLYPNPSTGATRLRYTASTVAELTITLYNATGQKLSREIRGVSEGRNNLDFDFSSLSKGTYFLQLESGNNREQQKLIIN